MPKNNCVIGKVTMKDGGCELILHDFTKDEDTRLLVTQMIETVEMVAHNIERDMRGFFIAHWDKNGEVGYSYNNFPPVSRNAAYTILKNVIKNILPKDNR